MTKEEKSRQARAAETKRRRNRAKLIQAADDVMREEGLTATVEGIAKAAGLSTATFYTFYTSRNALCIDAFTEAVVTPLERMLTPSQPVKERVELLGKCALSAARCSVPRCSDG